MTRLSVTVDAHPHFSVVTLLGDLDKSSAPQLEEKLAELMRRGHTYLIVDTAKLGFCDSTGIWVLLTSLRRAYEQKGWLRLAGVHGFLGRLLDLTRLREAFPIDPSVEESIREVSHGRAASNGSVSAFR
ncbi:anti-anti-sigma factor [Streptosporangium becharense]|uniref:Anti-sigma factor antagonist n=1 Tax=Streptosporangium becharense TaxID=1816182 RepID=A0A7W9IKA2_9ACTN|nr:STAS domain-containing protein [Streptosporangium becharense]MBB2911101.1 anti-anti-sigma factor [Streptosporangium becharense]MBB5821841.1 anti-anti-sigma factor [Streptosporangium becharense]